MNLNDSASCSWCLGLVRLAWKLRTAGEEERVAEEVGRAMPDWSLESVRTAALDIAMVAVVIVVEAVVNEGLGHGFVLKKGVVS